ncbi:MAG TPA: hypothetical protein VFY65_12820 [Longimicrobium sp.]|nr:hypothetical protein [Longimicrobium sp.]
MRPDRRALAPLVLAAALLGAAAPAQGQTWRNVTSARQAQGERNLNVAVAYGGGDLQVRPGSTGLLYRMHLRYDERQMRPVTAYDRASGRLRLGVESVRRNQRASRGGNAVMELAPGIPTDLSLEFGAGEAELELGGLSLRNVDLSTGASDTEVRFAAPNRVQAGTVRVASGASRLRMRGLGNARAERFVLDGGVGEATLEFDGAWARDASLNVEMGLGSLTLRFPRALGVKIEREGFLTRFSPAGMVRRDGAWYSRNWDSARHKLTVRIDAALGSIDVQWMN